MSAIQSPATIYKLWGKVNERYGTGKEDAADKAKASPKDKAISKQNEKVGKGLLGLRTLAKAGIKAPSQVKQFEKSRDKTVQSMKKYCKLIKSAKLEGAEDPNKFRKSVKQLTVAVEGLSAALIPAVDEGHEDISALVAIDTAALDKAMEDPKFGEYPDEELDDEDAETETTEGATPEATETAETAKDTTVKDDAAEKFTKHLKSLMPAIKQAQSVPSPTAQKIPPLMTESHALAQKKDYAGANKVLDQVQELVKQTMAEAVAKNKTADKESEEETSAIPPGAVGRNARVVWLSAKDLVDRQIGALQAELRGTGNPRLQRIADAGLNGVSKNLNVGLAVSLMELDLSAGDEIKKAQAQALAMIDRYKKFVTQDSSVRLCDENPFGVAVTLRQTLGEALGKIEKMIRSAAK